MSESDQTLSVVRRVFAAFAAHDLDAFRDLLDPDIVRAHNGDAARGAQRGAHNGGRTTGTRAHNGAHNGDAAEWR